MGLFGKRKAKKEEYMSLTLKLVEDCRKKGNLSKKFYEIEMGLADDFDSEIIYDDETVCEYMLKYMTNEELEEIDSKLAQSTIKRRLTGKEVRWVTCDELDDELDLNFDDDSNALDLNFDDDSLEVDFGQERTKSKKGNLDDDDFGFSEDSDDDDFNFNEKRKATKEEHNDFAKLFVKNHQKRGDLIEAYKATKEKVELTFVDVIYDYRILRKYMIENMTSKELLILKKDCDSYLAKVELERRGISDDNDSNLDDDDELDLNFDDEDSDEDDSDDDFGFNEDSEDDKKFDTSEMEDKLAKLKKLLDKGLISESDYNKRKEKLLDEMLNDDD